MTRIISYNIQAGGQSIRTGSDRTAELIRIVETSQAAVVGLLEATNPQAVTKPRVVERLAERLGMRAFISEYARHRYDYQPALLTRLPVIEARIHPCPHVLSKPLIELCVEEPGGGRIAVFLAHLSSAFNQGWAGEHIRRREIRHILGLMAARRDVPHVLMGDFNALAPGDRLHASAILRHIVAVDARIDNLHHLEGEPHLDFVVPPRLRFLKPLLRLIARSPWCCALFDHAAALYAPRGSVGLLNKRGYVDCFRRMHPHKAGFTYSAIAPAGRIDFMFASPRLARRLRGCTVVTASAGGAQSSPASDHLPLLAHFA